MVVRGAPDAVARGAAVSLGIGTLARYHVSLRAREQAGVPSWRSAQGLTRVKWTRHVFELRRDTRAAGDGPISREDFALHLLLSLGKSDVVDVRDAHDVFHLLAAGDDKLSLETALDAAAHDAPDRAAYGPPRTLGGDDDDEVEETKSPFASW